MLIARGGGSYQDTVPCPRSCVVPELTVDEYNGASRRVSNNSTGEIVASKCSVSDM